MAKIFEGGMTRIAEMPFVTNDHGVGIDCSHRRGIPAIVRILKEIPT